MGWVPVFRWLNTAPVWALGLIVLALMAVAAFVGVRVRAHQERGGEFAVPLEGQEGYLVSAVLGLLALLLGFTFSLAIDRFDARRSLVLQEANIIGTTYLRTQLLPEPHRTRISGLLVAYTDNRIALAKASPTNVPKLLAANDQLITTLWAATASGFTSIKHLDFSSSYLEAMNALVELDASRKFARIVRVPSEVFIVLVIYLITTAGVMGYVLIGLRGRAMAGFMLVLLTLALMLVMDIDRPTTGGVRETQGPMEVLQASLHARPHSVFDRFVIEDAKAPQSASARQAP
jgi:hypothetical protein